MKIKTVPLFLVLDPSTTNIVAYTNDSMTDIDLLIPFDHVNTVSWRKDKNRGRCFEIWTVDDTCQRFYTIDRKTAQFWVTRLCRSIAADAMTVIRRRNTSKSSSPMSKIKSYAATTFDLNAMFDFDEKGLQVSGSRFGSATKPRVAFKVKQSDVHAILLSPLKLDVWDRIQLYIAEFGNPDECCTLKSKTDAVIDEIKNQFDMMEETPDDEFLSTDFQSESMAMNTEEYDEVFSDIDDFELYLSDDDEYVHAEAVFPYENSPHIAEEVDVQFNPDNLAKNLRSVVEMEEYRSLLDTYNCVQGYRLLRFMRDRREGLHIGRQRALCMLNQLLYQGILKPVPALHSSVAEKRQMYFDENERYSFTNVDKRTFTDPNYRNYDFWLEEMHKSVVIQKRFQRGLKIYSNCFKGASLVTWCIERIPSIRNEEDAIFFLNWMYKQKCFADQTNYDSQNFELESFYQFHGNVLLMSDDEKGDSDEEDNAFGIDEAADESFNDYLDRVLDGSFQSYFCQLTDDLSILKVLLFVFSSNSFDDHSRRVRTPSNRARGSTFNIQRFVDRYKKRNSQVDSIPIEVKELATQESRKGREKEVDAILNHRRTLFELLVVRGSTFLPKLVRVFDTENEEAHALAIDVAWEVLKYDALETHFCRNTLQCTSCRHVDRDFNDLCSSYIGGNRCYAAIISKSILHIMVDEIWTASEMPVFNNTVIRPGVWKSYLLALRARTASEDDKLQGMKTAFSLLALNDDNARNFVVQEGWYDWILDFCRGEFITDANNPNACTLAHHILGHVLSQAVLDLEAFEELFVKFIDEVKRRMSRSLSTTKTVHRALQILFVVLSKRNMQMKCCSYFNIGILCREVFHFWFETAGRCQNEAGLHMDEEGEFLILTVLTEVKKLQSLFQSLHIMTPFPERDETTQKMIELRPRVEQVEQMSLFLESVLEYHEEYPLNQDDLNNLVSSFLGAGDKREWIEVGLQELLETFDRN